MCTMADSRYWSRDLITKFIEVYKANPCLWKVKSKEYTNKNLKNIAYEKLMDVCKTVNPEANRDYVVKKIQSFRGSFRKEVKKVLESKRSGVGSEDVYEPTLWYYNLLLFTSDQETPTASISNMDREELEVAEENEDEGQEENNERERSEWNSGSKTQESVMEVINGISAENSLLTQNSVGTSNASTITSTPSSSSMKSTNLTVRQKGRSSVNKRKSDFMDFCKQQLQNNNDINEYDAVGISWAKKLQRMDPMQTIFAEALINKVITQGLLKRLTDTTTLSDEDGQRSTPSSSYSQYTVLSNSSHQQWQVTSPTVPEHQVEASPPSLLNFYTTAASTIDTYTEPVNK